MHNGIIILDREGYVAIYNQAAQRIFKEPQIKPIGWHFSDVRPTAWKEMSEILRTGEHQLGMRIVFPEATIIANRSPIVLNNEVVGVISVFQDISEYEAIISELKGYKYLNKQLEAVIESSNDGLYITDGSGKTLRVNQAYEQITGLSRQDLIGQNVEALVARGFFDYSVTSEVLKKNEQISIMQKILGKKEVMVTGTPIYNEHNQIILVVTNVRDMTTLNDLEQELIDAQRVSKRYNQTIKEHNDLEHTLSELKVKSSQMLDVLKTVVKVSNLDHSILLQGESGVGKSMLAYHIHKLSSRKERSFVTINLSTIPESLMESELFGYEKGAFTGALSMGKAGLIDAAHTGTVFFDEIGELSFPMQAKLLQLIEQHTFNRLGASKQVSVDIRIIAATNFNLKEEVGKGNFREDLFYRLNVIPVTIPPLRERREDISVLVLDVLDKTSKGKSRPRISAEVMNKLMKYKYPGNVRELIHIVERMYIMSDGHKITETDMPSELLEQEDFEVPDYDCTNLKQAVKQFEKNLVVQALKNTNSIPKAAQQLGVHPSTVWRKIVEHELRGLLQ
jgi:PAS domain S-box-containing protein